MPDSAVQNTNEPVVIFDGVCGLCNRFVAFALRNDRSGELVFTPNRSPYGAALCERHHLALESERTILVVHDSRVLRRSDAVIFIATHLRRPYCHLALMRLIPRPVRELGYRVVAAIRRMIPVDHSACELLPPELQKRIRENV
jgi:predicted DCC family thiol-disulfide oxidoreductase YuxK